MKPASLFTTLFITLLPCLFNTTKAQNDSQYEKAKAIYQWECDNIEYDTKYKIYDGETCRKKKKGVCQAYCELFIMMAQECELEAEMITGSVKTSSHPNGDENHAWIKALTEKGWILIDPTWGAGTVNGHTFTPSNHDMSWFDVNPQWMIFSHLPDDPENQLLNQPITETSFKSLPDIHPFMQDYSFNAPVLLNYYLENPQNCFPTVHKIVSLGDFQIVDIPLNNILYVDSTYTFSIRNFGEEASPQIYLDNNEKGIIPEDEWTIEENLYTIEICPQSKGKLILLYGKTQKTGQSTYEGVLTYEIKKRY